MKKQTKVLIVDDEEHIRKLFAKIISRSEFEVINCAFDGNNAMDLFLELSPDIVLLDVNMPFKSGLEVLKGIISKNAKACIIMLTSVADLETVKKCIELGASGYIRKDEPINTVIQIIRETWAFWSKNQRNSYAGKI